MGYHQYINSSEWCNKRRFIKLLACIYRLSPFPLFGDAHHTHYENLYHEIYLRDVIVVGRFVHSIIIHGFLSGFKTPMEQAFYPNKAQMLFHMFYKIPFVGGITSVFMLQIIFKFILNLMSGGIN